MPDPDGPMNPSATTLAVDHAARHNRAWAALDTAGLYVGPPAAGSASGKDKAAVLAAFDAAKASATGGKVLFGPGFYDVGDLELVWPATVSKYVELQGGGVSVTTLKFSVDRGLGTFAMRTAGGVYASSPRVRDMTVSGPATSYTLGTPPANMRGIQVSSAGILERVTIGGFWAGAQIIGDHTTHYRVKVISCYYGYYWAQAANFGDHTFTDCVLTGNMRASMGVAHGGAIDAATFVRGHLGYSPFGIEFEPGGPARWVGMVDTQFLGTGFEYCGNGWIYNSDRQVDIHRCHFVGCRPWGSNPTYKIAALARQPDVYAYAALSCTVNGLGPLSWDCPIIGAMAWERWRETFGYSLNAGVTFLRGYMGLSGVNFGTLRLDQANCHAVAFNVTAPVSVGQVVEYGPLAHFVRPHAPTVGNGGSAIAGVAMTAATSGTDVCIVATDWPDGVPVQVAGAGPYGANDLLFANNAGKADNAAGIGAGYKDRAIIGRVGNVTAVSGGVLNGVLVKITDRAT